MFFLLFLHTKYSVALTGSEIDRSALTAIRDGVQGLSMWNQSIPFCQWQGITCSKLHRRVTALDLSDQRLVGTLSPHVGNLSFLTSLSLQNNKFHGEIPQETCWLLRLQTLNIRNNRFQGKIPGKLGSLSKLVVLDFTQNRLTGQIPPSLGNLSSLQIFACSSNNLSGEVPLPIYNISSMNTFLIDDNRLTGVLPPDMGYILPNLVVFRAGINQLSGHIPVSLANASRLQQFNVMSNNLTGQVPVGLGALQSLETLYLGDNQISGNIPEGIGNLASLIALGLEQNLFTGGIPSSIGNIRKLQGLFLQGNKLTGLIPTSLGNLSQLSELSLADNRLQGRIPSSLEGCRSLQALNLSQNNLNGTIPEEVVRNLNGTISWDLSKNNLTGSIPYDVGSLVNLGHLDISGNRLSGKIPGTLGECLSMEGLYLQHNLFEGKIPESLVTLRGIEYMDLSSNILSGGIPTYFKTLPFLERLDLSFNKFEGEVPTEGVFANPTAISVAGNSELCGGIKELQLPACPVEGSDKQGSSIALKVAVALSVALLFVCVLGFVVYLKRKPERKELQLPACRVEDSEKQESSTSLKVAVPLSVCLLFLCVLEFVVYLKRKLGRKASSPSKKKRLQDSLHPPKRMRGQCSKVSYGDLYKATTGFSPSNSVGSGSSGCVYKGIRKNMIVAVKVFNLQKKGSLRSFMAECEASRDLRHRNLIRVITSCSSIDFEGNDFKAIVFEYMPYGTLEMWLHGAIGGQPNRPWRLGLLQRLTVATDVASALNYLQHQCEAAIIHRDLKPSNILLDGEMVARVGDFGSAKLLSESRDNFPTNQTTPFWIMGSIGYIAPECGIGYEASIQSDMYSFGILVLEAFIGKRPTNEMFKDGLNLHNYANNALPDQVSQIVDPIILSKEDEMAGEFNSSDRKAQVLECLTAVIRIGVACSVESPKERMDIRDVTKELHTIREKMNLVT